MVGRTAGAMVVVSYASSALVVQNFAALDAAAQGVEMIVVDCFSSDDEAARVAAACDAHGWTALLLQENVGFGAGVNRGAELAWSRGAEVLVVVNPDATLDAPALRALVDAAAAEDVLVSPRIVRPDGTPWNDGADLYLDDGSTAGIRHRAAHRGRPRLFWLTGACFAISRRLWLRVGGYPDEYFLYWEDIDLSDRVQSAGGSLRLLDDVVAVHDEGGTHDDGHSARAKSETYYYYNIRNRLLFARLRLDEAAQRRWRRTALRVSWSIVMQGGRRQLLSSIAPWRALLRGLRDGLRGVSGPLGTRGSRGG